MRHGFTTGSCSAAAAKAATYMLFSGDIKNSISVMTPSGEEYKADIEDIKLCENEVSCAVRKDGGDDPDVTSGCLIYASVSRLIQQDNRKTESGLNSSEVLLADKVLIEGGEGVGIVTRRGLDQPVGAFAINSVPRKMITEAVLEVMDLYDYGGRVKVTISVPGGKEIAAKTFNPRLGIEGGISIIGTSGIVEPMSTRAIVDTIKVELNQKRQEGKDYIIVSPGNYGLEYMKEQYGYDLDEAVKCSNFIGETIDIANSLGYKGMLITGHMGKLIKVSGGIMNTHSKEADSRMELMAIGAIKAGADMKVVNNILASLTTEEAYKYIVDAGIKDAFSDYIMDKIAFYLKKRAGDMQIECIMYSNEFGLIGCTDEVKSGIDRFR